MSRNAVPLPPNPFPDDLHTLALPKGSELHRIYSPAFAGNAFNPTHAKLNRFSPIFDARGEVVPVLYAASSRAGAIYETLFHDAAIKGSRHKALPLKALNKHYGTWVTQRPLMLATLHAPDLARFGVTIDQLTATNAMYYPQTARWAEAIHRAHAGVEGLEWTSYRAGPERAYVLFGDRVNSADLVSAGNEMLIPKDAALFREVVDCGERVVVRIHRPKLP
jgi:RES domain